MRIIKKLLKVIVVIVLLVVLVVCGYLFNLDVVPEIKSKKVIDGIEEYAQNINDIDIDDSVQLIGLGEATHGNIEFQDLKLDVLKLLVEKENVKAFALEIDFGEGVIIDQYIKNNSALSIEEVMSHISFDIYRTSSIKSLIEWMRQYNLANNNELSFYGFDIQNPEVDMYVITEYIKQNHQELLSYTTNYSKFVNNEIRFKDEAMEIAFEDLEYIASNIDDKTIQKCIDNIFMAKELARTSTDDSSLVKYGEYRDQMMCKRILDILSNGEKLLISAHNGHVGYAGSYVKTMGANLKEQLKEKYFVIGTDYYDSTVNINSNNGRKNYRFCSADTLAYQARKLGTYYLDFAKVDESSNVYKYINEPINTGSIGESYSILNHILASSVRIHCEVNYLYDAMIFMYKVKPIEVINKN